MGFLIVAPGMGGISIWSKFLRPNYKPSDELTGITLVVKLLNGFRYFELRSSSKK